MRNHNLVLQCVRIPISDKTSLLDFVAEQVKNPEISEYFNEIEHPYSENHEIAFKGDLDHIYIHIHFDHPLDLNARHAIEVVKTAIKKDMIYTISCFGNHIDMLLH